MPKTKILIIPGAVAGLILVVGLAVGLTQRSKPTQIGNDSLGTDEITSVVQITEAPTEAPAEPPSETQNQTTPQPEEDDWGQWSNWTPCSQYCRQARMLRLQLYQTVSGTKSHGDKFFRDEKISVILRSKPGYHLFLNWILGLRSTQMSTPTQMPTQKLKSEFPSSVPRKSVRAWYYSK